MRCSFKFWLVGCWLEVACLVTTDDVGSALLCIALPCFVLFCFVLFSSATYLPACYNTGRHFAHCFFSSCVYISSNQSTTYQPYPTMKFTSIVFAAIVAATQFSSTFAAVGTNRAAADTKTTAFDTAVVIDVSGTDEVGNIGGGTFKKIKDALKGPTYEIANYLLLVDDKLTEGTVTKVDGTTGDLSNKIAGTPDTVTYTPKDGFVGEDTFAYTFTTTTKKSGTYGDISTASNSVTVKVIVSPEVIKQTFEIPGVVNSGNAVKYNHVGLSNIAAFTAGGPDTDSFNAIVKPVFGGSADFAANTSPEAVNNIFAKSWDSFIKIWRGGN
jgi:hypothetical protein